MTSLYRNPSWIFITLKGEMLLTDGPTTLWNCAREWAVFKINPGYEPATNTVECPDTAGNGIIRFAVIEMSSSVERLSIGSLVRWGLKIFVNRREVCPEPTGV